MKIQLEIPGAPVAQARPRFSTNGGFARAYKTKRQQEAQSHFQNEAKRQLRQFGHTDPIPAGQPLKVSFWFLMPIPKSSTKRFRSQCLDGRVYHVKKPDADNLIKFVKDALNKIAWHDDSQVAKLRGVKVYADVPKTVVLIEALD